MRDHEKVVTEQYDPVATAYLQSRVHAQGEDLQALAALAQQYPTATALDIGCGPGHVSFALAPHLASVTACDPSQEMLQVVRQTATERGLANIHTERGRADALPFADATFDWVVTRYSAHHWPCIQTAVQEMRRVVKPGGKLIVIDAVSPRNALLATWLQTVELLRDTSHVRNRTLEEWHQVFAAAGLEMVSARQWRVPLEFTSWITRMRTPPERVAAIQSLWQAAPAEVRDHWAVQADGSFVLDVAWMEAERST